MPTKSNIRRNGKGITGTQPLKAVKPIVSNRRMWNPIALLANFRKEHYRRWRTSGRIAFWLAILSIPLAIIGIALSIYYGERGATEQGQEVAAMKANAILQRQDAAAHDANSRHHQLVAAISESRKDDLARAFPDGYMTFGATMQGNSPVVIDGRESNAVQLQHSDIEITKITPDFVFVRFPKSVITFPNTDSNLPPRSYSLLSDVTFAFPRKDNVAVGIITLPDDYSLEGKVVSNGDPVVVGVGVSPPHSGALWRMRRQ